MVAVARGAGKDARGPKAGTGSGGRWGSGIWNAVILTARGAGKDARGPKTVRVGGRSSLSTVTQHHRQVDDTMVVFQQF